MSQKISFVHIIEQIQYEPGTAQLSALAKNLGWETQDVPCDYGTPMKNFASRLAESAPDLLALRISGGTFEVLTAFLGPIREGFPELPIVFYGPLGQQDPTLLKGLLPKTAILWGESEAGFCELLKSTAPFGSVPIPGVIFNLDGEISGDQRAEALPAADLPPPDLEVFGGLGFLGRATACSFFGEAGVLPLETSLGCPAGPAENAALNYFNHPTVDRPRSRSAESIAAYLQQWLPSVQALEIQDREFGWDLNLLLNLLPQLGQNLVNHRVSLRVLPNSLDVSALTFLDPKTIQRVVMEYDAHTEAQFQRLPGAQSPQKVEELVRGVSAQGSEACLLVSLGLPYESADDIRQKIANIRSWGVKRVRLAPFVPRWGSESYALCMGAGMLPEGEAGWNREVYTPLKQECMPIEEWHQVWQECLNFQAECQSENSTTQMGSV